MSSIRRVGAAPEMVEKRKEIIDKTFDLFELCLVSKRKRSPSKFSPERLELLLSEHEWLRKATLGTIASSAGALVAWQKFGLSPEGTKLVSSVVGAVAGGAFFGYQFYKSKTIHDEYSSDIDASVREAADYYVRTQWNSWQATGFQFGSSKETELNYGDYDNNRFYYTSHSGLQPISGTMPVNAANVFKTFTASINNAANAQVVHHMSSIDNLDLNIGGIVGDIESHNLKNETGFDTPLKGEQSNEQGSPHVLDFKSDLEDISFSEILNLSIARENEARGGLSQDQMDLKKEALTDTAAVIASAQHKKGELTASVIAKGGNVEPLVPSMAQGASIYGLGLAEMVLGTTLVYALLKERFKNRDRILQPERWTNEMIGGESRHFDSLLGELRRSPSTKAYRLSLESGMFDKYGSIKSFSNFLTFIDMIPNKGLLSKVLRDNITDYKDIRARADETVRLLIQYELAFNSTLNNDCKELFKHSYDVAHIIVDSYGVNPLVFESNHPDLFFMLERSKVLYGDNQDDKVLERLKNAEKRIQASGGYFSDDMLLLKTRLTSEVIGLAKDLSKPRSDIKEGDEQALLSLTRIVNQSGHLDAKLGVSSKDISSALTAINKRVTKFNNQNNLK